MNLAIPVSVGSAMFLLALGIVLWMEAGDAVFRALTEFGTLLCM